MRLITFKSTKGNIFTIRLDIVQGVVRTDDKQPSAEYAVLIEDNPVPISINEQDFVNIIQELMYRK